MPISISGSFTLEYDELEIKNLKDYFASPQLKNLKIIMYDSKGYEDPTTRKEIKLI